MNKLFFTNIHWITIFSAILIIIIAIIIYFSTQKNENKIINELLNQAGTIKRLNNDLLNIDSKLNDNRLFISNSVNHILKSSSDSTNYLKNIIDKPPQPQYMNLNESALLNTLNNDNNNVITEEEHDENAEENLGENAEENLGENDENAVENDDENTSEFINDNELKNDTMTDDSHDQILLFLNNKSKNELTSLCKDENLTKSGNKDILIQRLMENGYSL